MGSVRRLSVLAVLAVLAAPPAGAAVAPGPRSVKKAIWGPTRFAGRSQFPIYRDLGVGIYQQSLSWASVAPTRPAHPRDPADPAYRWPEDVSYGVQQSLRYHIRPLLMAIGSPEWSNGGRGPTAPPLDPKDYADFLEAASRRYPGVHHWMVWGEPNRIPNYLIAGRADAIQKDAPPFTALQRLQDERYAELVDAAYGRLKRRSRRNLIIGGNTTTSGDVDPWNWIKNLKLKSGRPPRMDLYGHNPFAARAPDLNGDQLVKGTADICDLDLLASWLDRYLARPTYNRRLPIFISEYNAPTDTPGYEFPYHVTRAVQARWLRAAFAIERRWGRIYSLGWQPLRDVPPRLADGLGSPTGLIDGRGVRKPAYDAFKRARF